MEQWKRDLTFQVDLLQSYYLEIMINIYIIWIGFVKIPPKEFQELHSPSIDSTYLGLSHYIQNQVDIT